MPEKNDSNPINDQESSSNQSKELQKKKRSIKCYACLAAFAVILTIVILIFSLTVMRFKPPKPRLARVTVRNSTAFIGNKRLSAQVIYKNTNFLKFEVGSNTAWFVSDGVIVGQFVIPGAQAKARSTERVQISGDFSGPIGGGGGGVVVVKIQATFSGKMVLMKVFFRRKSVVMDCTFSVNFLTNDVQGVTCR